MKISHRACCKFQTAKTATGYYRFCLWRRIPKICRTVRMHSTKAWLQPTTTVPLTLIKTILLNWLIATIVERLTAILKWTDSIMVLHACSNPLFTGNRWLKAEPLLYMPSYLLFNCFWYAFNFNNLACHSVFCVVIFHNHCLPSWLAVNSFHSPYPTELNISPIIATKPT